MTTMTGQEFAALRKAVRLSSQGLAEAMGVHKTTVSRWERGHLAIPTLAALALRWLHHERRRMINKKIA